MYNKDKTKLLAYPMGKIETKFEVPDYVKEIGFFAFYYTANLEEISFEGKVDTIDEIVFSELRAIKKFYYPVRVNVESAILTNCQFSHIDVYISKEVSAMNDRDFIGSDVTLHVYDNSYALEWAKEHNFSYEIIEEEPIEKELIDTNTGIKVEGTMDTDATLKVEKVENSAEDAAATYDITLQKDGALIQPDGTITVKIPSNAENCKVMWLKDDGTAEDMNAKYTDGCYVFTTDHLSVYALVQDKTILTGDANKDGIVNVNDVTYLQMHIAGNKKADGSSLIDETNKQLFDSVDMNKDGKISVLDVTALQMYITENNN